MDNPVGLKFEDLIDDWMGITTLTPERLGTIIEKCIGWSG